METVRLLGESAQLAREPLIIGASREAAVGNLVAAEGADGVGHEVLTATQFNFCPSNGTAQQCGSQTSPAAASTSPAGSGG